MISFLKVLRHNIEYVASIIGLSLIIAWVVFYTADFVGNVFINLILVLGSITLLLGASEIILEYSLKLAQYAGVSEIVIGLTIVSIGTSIPEMFTAVASASQGVGAFVIGDIYGSYITQLTIFLGIVILCAPTTASKRSVQDILRDGPLVILALCILSLNIMDGELTRLEAGISIGLYVAYNMYLFIETKRHTRMKLELRQLTQDMEYLQGMVSNGNGNGNDNGVPVKSGKNEIHLVKPAASPARSVARRHSRATTLKFISMILLGAFLCYIGAHFCVTGGVNLAQGFGVPSHVIGATIVGFGTGFPEFVVSFMAIRKKRIQIAYGNLLGSNIVDPLLSISLGVMVNPITLDSIALGGILGFLLPFAVIVDLIIIGVFCRKKSPKWQGITIGLMFIGLYVGFLLGSR